MQEPQIMYEDAEVLVVNKPAGMIVYPDGKHDYPALSHWLEKKYGDGQLSLCASHRPRNIGRVGGGTHRGRV